MFHSVVKVLELHELCSDFHHIRVNMHPHHNQLPVDLIAQLVEHCTGVAEVKFQILLRYEFLSLQVKPSQIFCSRSDCLVSQTWLVFEGNVEKITHEREFRFQETKTRRQLALVSWNDVGMNGF